VDVGLAGRHVEFDVGHTGTVLSAVVLLFHEQIQLLGWPKRTPVDIYVVLQGLFQANQCNSALMVYKFAHGIYSFRKVSKLQILSDCSEAG
jgi:hypothetical protein